MELSWLNMRKNPRQGSYDSCGTDPKDNFGNLEIRGNEVAHNRHK